MEDCTGVLVVGHADALARAELTYQFRRLGWAVHSGSTGPELRQLARQWRPAVVILASDLGAETGWLTCAKLRQEMPDQEIVLLEPEVTPEMHRYARFVSAARLVCERDGLRALVDAVLEVAPAPSSV